MREILGQEETKSDCRVDVSTGYLGKCVYKDDDGDSEGGGDHELGRESPSEKTNGAPFTAEPGDLEERDSEVDDGGGGVPEEHHQREELAENRATKVPVKGSGQPYSVLDTGSDLGLTSSIIENTFLSQLQ